jgi:uncharacterized RDD family membrane protein YckC
MNERHENETATGGPASGRAQVFEGLSIQLTAAPIGKRILAYGIDMGIISAAWYAVLFVAIFFFIGGAGITGFLAALTRHSGEDGKVLFTIAMVLMGLLVLLAMAIIHDGYFIYCEFKRGTTVGKNLFGMKVVSLRPGRMTMGQVVMRHLLRYIDCALILPGIISMLSNEKRQRLGDMAASTLVVYSAQREKQATFMYLTQQDYLWLVEAYPPLEIPESVAQSYLRFAYPEFMLNKTRSTPELLAQWEAVARPYISNADPGKIPQATVLRYFAELCFIKLNH